MQNEIRQTEVCTMSDYARRRIAREERRRKLWDATVVLILSSMLVFIGYLLIYVTDARAQVGLPKHLKQVPINFYCVQGPGGISEFECRTMIRLARRYIKQSLGMKLVISKITTIPQPLPELATEWQNGQAYLYALEDLYRNTNPHRIQFFIAPPFISSDGRFWILGYTIRKCSTHDDRPAISYSTAEMVNNQGEPRYWQSVNAMVHEIGHALGASHYSDFDQNNIPDSEKHHNIMELGALSYVTTGFLPWKKVSLVEMNYCARGKS